MKKKVWLTDVTEFRLDGKEDKLYLSLILDVFSGEIISYLISKKPNIQFTNKALDEALNKFEILEDLVIHSDQGFHYQHNSWVEKLKNRGIKQSMSRKGNCIDNSPMENFFGLLKQEMFYGEKFKSYQHLKIEIEEYIRWYNIDRIKEKLNGLSPVKYRLQSA
ncbi:IS3 family transposase [Helcococcus kunzii]|nr:IS3 family transposase [Helcococcus kunzii]